MKIGRIIGLSLLALSLSPSIATKVLADGGDATLIHGCVAKDGTTRIVSPTTGCKNNETPRHWPTEARIVTHETRITNTENKNTTQDAAISAIQTKNNQQDADITALQGQVGGGSSGLIVKDSLGQVVGKYLDGTRIFLKIGTDSLAGFVQSSGFVNNGVVSFLHTTNDCSETRYLFSDRSFGSFTDPIFSFDGQTGYYATLPAQELLIQSREDVHSVQELAGVGQCVSQFVPPIPILSPFPPR
jgi:hypothetical protein